MTLILLSFCCCGAPKNKLELDAKELTASFKSTKHDITEPNEDFKRSMADFSVNMLTLKSSASDENVALPVFGMYNSLCFLGSGAGGNALVGISSLIFGKKRAENFDRAIASYRESVIYDDSPFALYSALWINDNVDSSVKEDFLQKAVDCYSTEIYKLDFGKNNLSKQASKWLDFYSSSDAELSASGGDIMYHVSATDFKSKWKLPISPDESCKFDFTCENGEIKNTDFMISQEETYIDDDTCRGFIKQYKDKNFSFALLLPTDGISMQEFLTQLNGEKLLSLTENAEDKPVIVKMPKFEISGQTNVAKLLDGTEYADIFSKSTADYSGIMREEETLYLSDIVCPLTFSVNEFGSCVSEDKKQSGDTSDLFDGITEREELTVNRPFVFAVIDNESKLPLIMGTVRSF